MKNKFLMLFLLGANVLAEEPDRLVELRKKYVELKTKAVSEVDKKYIVSLESLMTIYTKQNDLDSAVLVRDELNKIKSQMPESGNVAEKKLSDLAIRRERKNDWLLGKWKNKAGKFMILEKNGDCTMKVESGSEIKSGKWKVEDNQLIMKWDTRLADGHIYDISEQTDTLTGRYYMNMKDRGQGFKEFLVRVK